MNHPFQTAVAVAAALVAAAFALSTLERWLARRRRHEAAWTLALLLAALAAAALATGAGGGWTPATFRTFYLFGAVADVPVLALGTVYLLAGRRTADRAAAGVALAVAFAAGVIAVAPLRAAVPAARLPQGSEVFGPLPRVLAAVASGVGAVVILAGAVVSARRYRRGRMVWANGLIAAGTVVLGASGLLNSVLGAMTAFAVTLLAGLTVVFAGFLVAAHGTGAGRPDLPPAPPWWPAQSGATRPDAVSRPVARPEAVRPGPGGAAPPSGAAASRPAPDPERVRG